jgi:hypothetical protein
VIGQQITVNKYYGPAILVAGLVSQWLRFEPRPGHVEFVVDKSSTGGGFSPGTSVSHASSHSLNCSIFTNQPIVDAI